MSTTIEEPSARGPTAPAATAPAPAPATALTTLPTLQRDPTKRPPESYGTSNRFVNMLVYGDTGVGKTYLAGTGPKPAYLMDCDVGQMTLGRVRGVHPEPVRTLLDVRERIAYVRAGLEKDPEFWRLVAFDDLTELQRLVVYHLTKGGKAQQDDWGLVLNMMGAVIRDVRELPCHKLFIAKLTIRNGKASPSFQGQTFIDAPAMFDEIGYVQMRTMNMAPPNEEPRWETVRAIQFWPSQAVTAKDRSGVLAEYEIPDLDQIIAKITNAHRAEGDGIR